MGTTGPAAGGDTKSGGDAKGARLLRRRTRGDSDPDLADLRARLLEAEETLLAIRSGAVDAVVTEGRNGLQVFTLEGADHAYRLLIESMNEGALTLTDDKVILYANQCFARMVRCPLEQVTGSSFRRFLSAADNSAIRPQKKRPSKAGTKVQLLLHACDGSQLPVQVSVHSLDPKGANQATLGMVVTDMTEARRTEDLLRTLTHRVVQAQEAERRRVALDVHDHITQLVCASLFRSQMLANQISTHETALKQQAIAIREMLRKTAEETERISRGLRPSVLDELGLANVLPVTTMEFAERTGVSVELACVPLVARLPSDIELTLYRILQEALKNVEQHSRANHVAVQLTTPGAVVRLSIHDDGIGFDLKHQSTLQHGDSGIGLISMRERATYSGGALKVKSVRRPGRAKRGTTIEVEIPLGS